MRPCGNFFQADLARRFRDSVAVSMLMRFPVTFRPSDKNTFRRDNAGPASSAGIIE
jgi:hypothetical protein